MINKKYDNYNEEIYYEKLDNGLEIVLVPKNDFYKTYATFSTSYGSINNKFIPYGKKNAVSLPAGIAHFLEHKMFDKKDYDAFDLFSKTGASSNAFTSFTKTSYLFSCVDNLKANIGILLDFVQSPYFTDKKVEKEKGIIGQEISMYDDDPDAAIFFGTVSKMYPDFPLNVDIAGTVESISKITAEDLYTAYNTFYQPGNMQLNIVGNMDVNDVVKFIKANQAKKTFKPYQDIKNVIPKSTKIIKDSKQFMNITRNKVAVGIKGQQLDSVDSKYELGISLLLELLFSESSSNYNKLYNKGIIDDSFGFDFEFEKYYNFALIAGDTDYPNEFITEIKNILLAAVSNLDDLKENFELIKKEELGQHISMMNSIEAIANNLGNKDNNYTNLYDEINIINSITLEDLKLYAQKFINKNNIVTNIISPKS
ncbi:m16c subfamily protease [Apilactobacillus ozensis DSM 23829 = JCM 17196]|uniref:M16c subfamily protease n=2 Tax=Apilactobacillus ozensis TaxID=866801 RepID=A0A0R2AXD9_9LACO|nr:pitrilysin family protein [Apilactobacillus ozensis]KRM68699.1 m16c subfamily protease [Apilactobacillus ozensis DSM 23829 = JCM 17196]